MRPSLRRVAAAALLALPIAAWTAPIYPDPGRAVADIDDAVREAARAHRHVLVDFGGDWCTDCKVLDAYMRRPENARLVARFVVVHVNVGARGIDRNFDVAKRYGVPLEKGVPALAVLDSSGNVIYSQEKGEFESMRHMDPASVHEFLEKWSE
jgi:thiol-disulfide isomerase/thioredoxin